MSAIWIKTRAAQFCLLMSVPLWRPYAQGAPPVTHLDDHYATAETGPPKTEKTEPNGDVAELFKKSRDLIDKDRASEAIPLLRRAIEITRNNGRLHHYLGYALLKTGQLPAAQKEFEAALKLEPGNVYSEYFLAQVLDSQGLRERALSLYEAIVASGNVIYNTYQRLGQAYARKKEFDIALAMTHQALQQTPWDGAVHYQLGTIYRQMGREDAARQEFETSERLKRVDQSSIQKMLDLSEAVHNKDKDRTLALRRELLNQSGNDPEIMTGLGVLLGQGGLYADALEPLQKASAAGPCSYETCYNLGLTLAKLGKEPEAEVPLKQALALRPDSYEVNLVLAITYVDQGRNRDAIEQLREAHKVQPENLRVLLLLGQQYLEGWYLQEAIGAFREALRRKPDDSASRYLLIEAYQNDKAYDKALEAAREALKLHPREARAHFEVGHQLANVGHYQEGRPYFEESARLEPSFVPAYVWLGDLQLRNGEYEAALQSYQKARNLDLGDLSAARGIGRSLIRLKRFPEALTELQRFIADHPEDAELFLQLSQVYARLGDPPEAERAHATFEKLHASEVERNDSQRPRTFSP